MKSVRRFRFDCSTLAGLSAAALVPALASIALANDLTWNGTTSNANQTAKWSPSLLPGASDNLFFPGATAFTITFDATAPSVLSHTYRNTVTATLTINSPHSVGDTFDIGTTLGDAPIVHLGTGALSTTGTITLGDVSGSSGTMTIDGSDASATVTGAINDIVVGRAGTGTFTITGGGLAQAADDIVLGSSSTGSGTATVSGGTGSLPNVILSRLRTASGGGGDIIVGSTGDGTLHLQNGGAAIADHDLRIATSSSSNSSVDCTGSFSIFSSRVTVGHNFDIARNDLITACGTAAVTFNSATGANVGGATRIGDPNGGSGTLTLNGGFITSTGGIDIQSTGTLTGTGTVDADITNLGDITPTGAGGLTINGVLSNTTNNVIGTKIVFGPGGGYSGSGTCQADISGDPTSTITATGMLSIGNNTTTGFFWLGTLDVGGNIVTLDDSNGAVLGGLTTINSGRIECSAGIGVQNGGTLQGDGLLVADLIMSGVLDPHTSNTFGGLITVQGDLLMNPTGVMDMEIGGSPPSSNNDRANVSGAATFDGTMRVKLKNGYIPHVGEQFIAINATGGRSGTFASIIPPNPVPCNNVTFVMVYSSTAAIVLVRPPLGCTALGDLNSDGKINGIDIQLFVNDLVSGSYHACSDMNGDCVNSPADIPIMLNALL